FLMRCYIGVGSNLGDREKNIQDAVQGLKEIEKIEVKKLSRLYETDPLGGPPQGKYLNGAIELDTTLSPRELLLVLLGIERSLGRQRTIRNGPRTIDLDILIYGDEKINEPDLKIPHPRMREREFVQRPLRDIYESV
ncbi:MAG: 2-amino-4-hydroxy-6-hydroxymethyldihydropteridine diphosphokinase, partial [Candidatus Omnitrophota bacterium]|nr:2-amino-4-hydroxy-6-hydroxymethyldihydropteridine diphosphokinase [Candidatus Omnitrophota bacterium]